MRAAAIVAVIPSRGRPSRAYEAALAARVTARLPTTSVVLAVDHDDPLLGSYQTIEYPGVDVVVLDAAGTGDLVRATNTVSMRIARENPDAIIGNLGDDHLVRTPGWDRLVEAALETPGLAYGRDGIHDEHMPTAPFISARIPLALGWYALPTCRHLYIDNVWRDIAEQAGVRRYLPDLMVEHMHPAVGKADWDDGYVRANDALATNRDHRAYLDWRRTRMAADVARVRAAL